MEALQDVDEAGLASVVDRFYAKVRADAALAPVFQDAVADWPAHQKTLSAFWSSVMLTSGRYKGNPVAAHLRHASQLTPALFGRWLALWAEATAEILPHEAALAMQARAGRIAASLQHAVAFHAATPMPARQAG